MSYNHKAVHGVLDAAANLRGLGNAVSILCNDCFYIYIYIYIIRDAIVHACSNNADRLTELPYLPYLPILSVRSEVDNTSKLPHGSLHLAGKKKEKKKKKTAQGARTRQSHHLIQQTTTKSCPALPCPAKAPNLTYPRRSVPDYPYATPGLSQKA